MYIGHEWILDLKFLTHLNQKTNTKYKKITTKIYRVACAQLALDGFARAKA